MTHNRILRRTAHGLRTRWACRHAVVWLAVVLAAGAAQSADEAYTWQPLRVGAGGFLTGLDIAPDGTRVVRTDTYGAYKWNRTTSVWEQLVTTASLPAVDAGIDLNVAGVFEIRIASIDTSTMYMALRGYVYKTTNGGASWTRTNFAQLNPNDSLAVEGIDRVSGEKMAIDPANADVVYVGSRLDGMFVTDDGGSTWSSVTGVPGGSIPGITGICFDNTSAVVRGKTQVIYASSAGIGTYRSANAGASWTRISDGTGGTPTTALHGVCANGKYYVTAGTYGNGVLWKYTGSWTNIEPTPGQPRSHSISVDPSDANRLVVGMESGNLVVSRDDGASWDPIVWTVTRNGVNIPWHGWTGENYMSNGAMQFDPAVAGKLWFAQGIGVWHTTLNAGAPSSVAWNEDSVGIEQIVGNVVSAPPGKSTIHLAGWDRGVFSTSDVDAFPTSHGPVQAFNHAWWVGYAATDPSTVVVVDNYNGNDFTATSANDGTSWTQLFADTPVALRGGTGAASTASNIIVIGSNEGPGYYTTNGGSAWKPLSLPGVQDTSFHFAFFLNRHIVTADHVTPNKFWLYKSSKTGHASSDGLFRSTDGGARWTRVYAPEIAPGSVWNSKLASVPGKEDHLFFSSGQTGVLGQANPDPRAAFKRSTDGGSTWVPVPNVLEVYSFGFGDVKQPANYPAIFIAGWVYGEWGIWRSDDEGATWAKIANFPLDSFDLITAVEGAKDGTDRVYLGFRGSGYAYGVPSSTSSTEDPTRPQAPILLP